MSDHEPPQPAPPPGDPLAVILPRATRFRRGVMWSALGAAALLLAGVLAYGFLKSSPTLVAKSSTQPTPRPQQGPDFNRFPHDYTGMGPAKPEALAAVKPVTDTTAPPAAATAARPSGQPTEQQKAQASSVFFAQAPSLVTPNAAAAPASSATTTVTSHDAASPYGDQPLPAEAQGGLTVQKNAFLNSAANSRDDVPKVIQSPVSPYEILIGAVIPATLKTQVNSDLPGDVLAQVSENVYDTATGHYLLVPQGSWLHGKYDSLISYGQDRALIVWDRLTLPNGDHVDLGGMPGTDGTGAAGLADQTDHHRLAFAGALAATTVLSFGPGVAQALAENDHSGTTTNVFAMPASNLGNSTSQIGENLLNRELNRPNTITVRPGWPLNVLINRDLVMRSYTNG